MREKRSKREVRKEGNKRAWKGMDLVETGKEKERRKGEKRRQEDGNGGGGKRHREGEDG